LIYQPVNLSPKNISIDAKHPYTFTWKSTGAPQTDYQIIIRKNDDDSLVYNSYKIQSAVSAHIVPKNTLQNGVAYKWQVQTWNNLDSAVSDWVYLSANTTPVLTFTAPDFNMPVYINSQDFTFKVNYEQAEGISVKKYRFILYDSTGENIIHDSNWQYGISLEYTITGMIRTESYKIECQAYDQNDMFVTTGKQDFTIAEYILPEGTPELQVTALDDIGAVEINWTTQVAQAKVVDDLGDEKTPKFVTGKFGKGLELASDEAILFERPVTTDYTLSFPIRLTYGHDGDFVEFDNGVTFGYELSTMRFYVNNNGVKKYSNPVSTYSFQDFTLPWTSYTKAWNDTTNFTADELIKGYVFIVMTEDDFVIKIGDVVVAESIDPEPEG
jgi:hypothetical protein